MSIYNFKILIVFQERADVRIKYCYFFKTFILVLIVIFLGQTGFSQKEKKNLPYPDIGNSSARINDSLRMYMLLSTCKNPYILSFHSESVLNNVEVIDVPPSDNEFLKIHGNILYRFSYTSYIDTPFAQTGLVQNLIETNFRFLIKNKYPFKITLSNRRTNSPYFKNATDINVEYNRRLLLDNIKDDLKNRSTKITEIISLKDPEQALKYKKHQVQQIQNWLNNPARIQELIVEKERNLSKSINYSHGQEERLGIKKISHGFPVTNEVEKIGHINYSRKQPANIWEYLKSENNGQSKTKLNSDSEKLIDSSFKEEFDSQNLSLTKLLSEIKLEENELKLRKKIIQDSISTITQQINGLNNTSDLYAFMKRNGFSKDSLSKAQRILLSINQIAIGRTYINYSELTVKNISLTGINVEANPGKIYFAASAGKVNYLFRDFIFKSTYTVPDQSLYLLRAGIGKKDKNNFIITYYNGNKAVLNPTSNFNSAILHKVLGVSLESRVALNANNYIIAEVAKSSYQNRNNPQQDSDLLEKALNFKIHTNEAYSIKLFSQNPVTNTKINAYFKKMGENFQSFNLYPVNVNESSWMIKANQLLWDRKISIDAAIRKNDFLGNLAIPSKFSTETIFKSLQISLRSRKYPFVSIGYYPTSQLSISDNNILTENHYNTLNTVLSHNYHLGKTTMNTNGIFTKFYNTSKDTGFIYFNASSYTLSHSIFLSLFTLQSELGVIHQEDLNLLTLEQSLSYQYKNKISLKGGLKWNRVSNVQNLYGGSAAMSFYLKKLGTIQFTYNKDFIQGYNRKLKPVDIGRMSYFRDF